jgi:hypothetical protein
MIIVETEVWHILDPNYAPMIIVETEVWHILDPNCAPFRQWTPVVALGSNPRYDTTVFRSQP